MLGRAPGDGLEHGDAPVGARIGLGLANLPTVF